jgi:phosphoglycerate dehydrogenase-like enzyme
MENLEIINTVRAMVMDKDQIMSFLSAMKTGGAAIPEITETEVSENE